MGVGYETDDQAENKKETSLCRKGSGCRLVFIYKNAGGKSHPAGIWGVDLLSYPVKELTLPQPKGCREYFQLTFYFLKYTMLSKDTKRK